MPLDAFIVEAKTLVGTDADEIPVECVKPLRNNPGPGDWKFVNEFNDALMKARG